MSEHTRTSLWPAFSTATEPFGGPPTVLREGSGCWISDDGGRRYLDGVGALEAMVVGHGRQRLAAVAAEQLQRLAFLDVFRYTSEPALALADKLRQVAPVKDARVHFTPGGSEAVETAMKVAIQYHHLRGDTSRRRFVGRHGAYHGVTLGAMSLGMSYYAMRNDIYLPTGLGVSADNDVEDPDSFGSGACHTSDAAAIERKILELGPEQVAGVVVDPLATASGVAVPPLDDLIRLREVCDRHGVLLIADEVITAWGHTGALFASELSGVRPDIVTVSKGLSSGYMPIGATIVDARVAELFSGPDGTLAHGQTYGGHPAACAVALENIAILEEERLCDRAVASGRHLSELLTGLLDRHRSLRAVRGRGLLLGLEICPNRDSAVAFADRRAAGTRFRLALKDAGLIGICVHPGDVLLLAPPLIISDEEIETMVAMIDAGLSAIEQP
jgi:putrescine aminotransferase